MITKVLSHALLAITVWLIATKILKKQHHRHYSLSIQRQISLAIGLPPEEPEPKKKKNKKNRKKGKKVEWSESVNTLQTKSLAESQRFSDKSEKSERSGKKVEKIQETGYNAQAVDQSFSSERVDVVERHMKKMHRVMSSEQQSLQRKRLVAQQLELIQNYFMSELEQIKPYSGNYGKYRLSIEGSLKSMTLEWIYNNRYPQQPIEVKHNRLNLNPLQLQKIDQIFKQNQEKAKQEKRYFYLFNLTTAIYQDCMLTIKDLTEEDKPSQDNQISPTLQKTEADLKEKPHQDIQAMKELYDEVFYLHDMLEKEEVSNMLKNNKEDNARVGMQHTRGRYMSQFQEMELIGEGGFGKVYKVRHKLDGNIYAIKKAVMNYEDLNDRKILKEVFLLSKLNHPNIVRYYQSWLEDANSLSDIIEDMDFSGDKDKIQDLQYIYKEWKHNRSGGIVFEEGSENSYNGSMVSNSGIVFEDNDDHDIVFEDHEDGDIAFEDEDGSDMNTPGRSSINQHSDRKSSQSSSMMRGMDGFPFKILYIAMELCNGINLREFINTRFDEEQQKVQILRGILQGLAYIHNKKIIHRDLKPPNIFLTQNNKVKIGDFGLAITQDRSINHSIGSIEFDPFSDKTKAVGTGFYRAPEQLKSNNYNEKVDIYSLGIIMFELFYQFRTAMQRADVLKELTQSHQLPKDFIAERKGTDILENITQSLKEDPHDRPSAAKLLQSFRNKYFTQLVSIIANPKHFQFSQLIKHLFEIKNEAVTPLMWRDYFKSYLTSKLERIYHIHRATLFPTLPLIPVQDYATINGQKIKANRSQKYLLLSNRGVVLEYTSNCLKTWLRYAKEDFRRKKQLCLEQQKSSLRRYTFEKIVAWRHPTKTDDMCFHQKMVTAFDLAYKLQEGFNPFYLCQILKICQAIVTTLHFTQRKPPIYLFHSQIFAMLAQQYHCPKNVLYGSLLSINDTDHFESLPVSKKIAYFQERNLPLNMARKLSEIMDKQFQDPFQLFQLLQLNTESQLYRNIEYEVSEFCHLREKIFQQENKSEMKLEAKSPSKWFSIRWKLLIPSGGCNGFFWQITTLKGLTSVEQYSPGLQFCNYHIEMGIDPEPQITDLSIWCVGQYLEEEMQRIVVECWKKGLTARWYDWQIGEREVKTSHHSIILKRKFDKVQAMIKYNNQQKKGEHKEERESSFINLELFNFDIIKQTAINLLAQSYH